MRPALRTLVLAPAVLAVVVGFAAFGIYVHDVVRDGRVGDLDAELVRAERQTLSLAGLGAGGQPAPGGAAPRPEVEAPVVPAESDDAVASPIQLVLDTSGRLLETLSGAQVFDTETLAVLADGVGDPDDALVVDAEGHRVRIVQLPGGRLSLTALPYAPVDNDMAEFRRALLLGAGLIVLVVVAVLGAVTTLVLRPVSRMADAANEIAAGDLDTDIPATGGARETGDLATDLNHMVGRLRGTIDRESAAADRARRARDDMNRLLGDLAHEVRTPLTALKGYSDLHAGGMLDDAGRDRAMERIGSESERLGRLADDMLALARHRHDTSRGEAVDVAALVDDVADDLLAAHPTHHIEREIGPDIGSVLGDRARLHQAVLNLGANACAHGGDQAPVLLRVVGAQEMVRLEVVDRGPGVPPEERQRIFLPFFRPDASRRRDGTSGAGLGLAVAKSVADEHGGSLVVEATPGGGATFVMLIPRTVGAEFRTEG